MDVSSLKTFVESRLKAGKHEVAPIEAGQQKPPNPIGDSEVMPDAGRVRQAWTLYQPPYKELPGLISKRALEQHLKLYATYLYHSKSIEGASPSERWRGAETDHVAGVVLHELFFQGLTILPGAPALAVQGALINRWNSLEAWWQEMSSAGMYAQGWAITALCERDPADLQVFMTYSHDHGLPPGYIPICAVDVYEHSYWMDHGTDRAKYLQEMYRFINWEALDERYTHATR